MSFFSLFSRKNNVEQQVEQLRTDLYQQMQGLQQAIIEEMRHIGKQQVYPQAPQLPDTLMRLPDVVKQLQLQIQAIPSLISQQTPIIDGTLDGSHGTYIQKTQKANDAIIDYIATHHKTQKVFKDAEEERNKEQERLHTSALDLFPDRQTDTNMRAIEPPQSEEA
jgi:hypothetical protein